MLAAIERYRVTVLAAVSTQFVMLLNSPALDEHDLSSLRVMFTGGEMVPYERAREFEARTGATVLQFYGSNETGALSATTLDDPPEQRLRTAGRVIPEMQVRLLDPDTDDDITRPAARACPRARARRCASATGTTPTPTSGCSPPTAGCAWATSRRSTPTATSRSSAAPPTSSSAAARTSSAAQVEDEVATHPAVALCAAVAMPDETFGERVCVFAELRAGARDSTLDELTRPPRGARRRQGAVARAPRRARRAPALLAAARSPRASSARALAGTLEPLDPS